MAIARPRRFVRGHHLKHPNGFYVGYDNSSPTARTAPSVDTWYQMQLMQLVPADARERFMLSDPVVTDVPSGTQVQARINLDGTVNADNTLYIDLGYTTILTETEGDVKTIGKATYSTGVYTEVDDPGSYHGHDWTGPDQPTIFPLAPAYGATLNMRFWVKWRYTGTTVPIVSKIGIQDVWVYAQRMSKRSLL